MATMAENVLAAGAENRPPMLEKGGYDTWQSRILLYIEVTRNHILSQHTSTYLDVLIPRMLQHSSADPFLRDRIPLIYKGRIPFKGILGINFCL
ncbi:hypothetical protein Tco_0505985 [Tanacetum coccineum]